MNLLYIYWTYLILCSAYALTKGAGPERMAIAIAIAASTASHLVVTASFALRYRQVETGVFVVDAVTLAAFVLLSLCADRFWPLWITGIHLVGVATHTAMVASPTVVPWVYSWIQGFWAYPILLIIVVGAMRHQKRLKRFGVDNSWNGFCTIIGQRMLRSGRGG